MDSSITLDFFDRCINVFFSQHSDKRQQIVRQLHVISSKKTRSMEINTNTSDTGAGMSVICCFKARQPWRGCAVIRLSSKQPEVFNSSAITWPITALPDPDIANTRLCPTFIPINHSFCATCHNLFYVPLTACIPRDYLTTQSYQLTMGAADMVGDKKKIL